MQYASLYFSGITISSAQCKQRREDSYLSVVAPASWSRPNRMQRGRLGPQTRILVRLRLSPVVANMSYFLGLLLLIPPAIILRHNI
jgi:hypothetical protein